MSGVELGGANVRRHQAIHVSEYFNLDRKQPALDFVDVDVAGDTRLFLDPRALRLVQSPWTNECVALLQDFFHAVLQLLKEGSIERAYRLTVELREPNETHLGLSKGRPRGRALGPLLARDLVEALSQSAAARSGLIADLEDTALLVPGVSTDIISDIATNIVRQPLIDYTQHACEMYGIPKEAGIVTGPRWNHRQREWHEGYAELPYAEGNHLLLVPKAVVRRRLDYDSGEYYRLYILKHLEDKELSANSELVRTLKSGHRYVTRRDLEKKYGSGKPLIIQQTLENPELLDNYKSHKKNFPNRPLNHVLLGKVTDTAQPDWQVLLADVTSITPGTEGATAYHRAVEKLLSALFYPSLSFPQIEAPLHEGRKRVDITYTNLAETGFFRYLAQHYPCPNIFVECKNYSADPGNPELDQLSGRFSPSRGQVGILICRNIKDRDAFTARCRDTANDQRGFIIALDDRDLKTLVESALVGDSIRAQFEILKQKFNDLVM